MDALSLDGGPGPTNRFGTLGIAAPEGTRDDDDDLRPALQRLGEQLRLRSAEPVALSAWQTLEDHLAVIAAIGAIAAQFGCRIARFPLIEEYTLADNFRLMTARSSAATAIWKPTADRSDVLTRDIATARGSAHHCVSGVERCGCPGFTP